LGKWVAKVSVSSLNINVLYSSIHTTQLMFSRHFIFHH
jgi:hypothetical protein